MNKFYPLIVVALSFALWGCDSSSSSGDSGSVVEYTAHCNGTVDCNTDDNKRYRIGDIEYRVCKWSCATYKGRDERRVEIGWSKDRDDACWDRDFVIDLRNYDCD